MSHCQAAHATSTAVSACTRWTYHPYLARSGATTRTISQQWPTTQPGRWQPLIRHPRRTCGTHKDGFTSPETSWHVQSRSCHVVTES